MLLQGSSPAALKGTSLKKRSHYTMVTMTNDLVPRILGKLSHPLTPEG